MFGEKSVNTQMVSNFQSENGYYGEEAIIDISGEYAKNEIPLFIQWDKRWGLYPYGKTGTIGSSGCGVTSLAMVVVGLTGDTTVNPKTMADYSVANGYRIEGVGTAWSLFTEGEKHFGINGTQINITSSEISETLRSGKPIIASMKKGHFTTLGHFIVLKGIMADGKIIVNDPNSYKLSEKVWDVSIIVNECKGMFAFEKVDTPNKK